MDGGNIGKKRLLVVYSNGIQTIVKCMVSE